MAVHIRSRGWIPALVLGASLMGCSAATSGGGPGDDVPQVDPSVAAAKVEAARVSASPTPASDPVEVTADPDRPELVRDAFAGLQATYQDNCAPGEGNCGYFLGRVDEELVALNKAMRADGQGPGHFKEPLAWIDTLFTTLDGDLSTPNLEKHRTELIGTRDRINSWMQGHPEDYR
ncbi:hypothetical protein [Streptomyces sp. NPDC060198]|uniref:hypothetical protein n=1 Tax=Streptomyces sp. NPDC060198 TaxID=3347070 RepID=UPI00364FBE9D